jgi:type III secretion protein D
MKQLRILTGQHAGAHVDLTSTRCVISADDTADVQILDWTSEPMVIEVDEDDMLRFATLPAGADEAPANAFSALADFAPRRVGDVVLCTGPADAIWPAEVDLIASLSAPATLGALAAPVAAAARKRPSPLVLSAFVGTALMTAAIGAAVARLGQGADRATDSAAANVPMSLKARIDRALATGPIAGVEVQTQGSGVVVRGLLNGPEDAQALRLRLASFQKERVVHAYAVATEVAQSIGEALGQPGLRVTHHGEGRFIVSGEAADIERLRDSAARIAADLAPLVRSVEVDATRLPPSSHAPLTAALDADGLQYVQTRDGVKHLSVSSAGIDVLVDEIPR